MGAFNNEVRLTYPCVMAFILSVCLLAGCSGNGSLSTEAQKAVEDTARNYYTNPWQGNTHFDDLTRIEITRAWRAKDLDDSDSSGEMWCLEVAVSPF